METIDKNTALSRRFDRSIGDSRTGNPRTAAVVRQATFMEELLAHNARLERVVAELIDEVERLNVRLDRTIARTNDTENTYIVRYPFFDEAAH